MNKTFVFCGLMAGPWAGCGQGVSPTFNAPLPGPTPTPLYPRQVAIKQLPPSKSIQGIKALKVPSRLNGTLSWVGNRDVSSVGNPHRAQPLLQLASVKNGSIANVQKYELPTYDSQLFSMGQPLFWQKGKSFLRLYNNSNSDVGAYELYTLDLTKLSAKSYGYGREFFSHMQFQISPGHKYYAYETSDPWTRAGYQVVLVDENGKKKTISKDELSDTFSWTPRNTLIYPAYIKGVKYNNKFGFPDIVENDLKGHIKIIKRNGHRPLMSPTGRYLATFVGYVRPGEKQPSPSEVRFYTSGDTKHVALAVYDMRTKRDRIVTAVDMRYPDLFWSKDGQYLYMVENIYYEDKKIALCRISEYDVQKRRYRRIAHLKIHQSKTVANNYWQPNFNVIKLANNSYLILTANLLPSGKDNSRVIAVDLHTGIRHDLFAFSNQNGKGIDVYGSPLIDWIDAK